MRKELQHRRSCTTTEYDAAHNQPSIITDAMGNTTCYRYDARGRKVAEWGTGIQPAVFSYDDADRLTTLTTFRANDGDITTDPSERTDGDTTRWTYHDATGLETRKTYADGSSIAKTYDAYNRLSTETDARGNVKTHTYEHARGLLQGTTYSDDTTARSYQYNHLGQLTQGVNDAGTRIIGYTPYGGVTSSGSTPQSLQWSSEFYDIELGLVYYNFRHYNPICAQWITIDPLLRNRKETGYGYVRSLSIIYIDYLGLLFSQQQPQPPNTSEQRKRCSDAGLKEPDRKAKESCESYVKNAMKAKKIVDLVAVLAQNKCDVPPVVCKCCQDECKGAGGWHFPNRIVMCTNGYQSRINTTNYLGHELTHHLQKCQKRSGGSCINSLKNEVEAYKTHIKGCKNIVSSAQGSVLLGGQCKKEELTKEVIKEATEYCESLK